MHTVVGDKVKYNSVNDFVAPTECDLQYLLNQTHLPVFMCFCGNEARNKNVQREFSQIIFPVTVYTSR